MAGVSCKTAKLQQVKAIAKVLVQSPAGANSRKKHLQTMPFNFFGTRTFPSAIFFGVAAIISGQVASAAPQIDQELNLMSVNNADELERALCMNTGVNSKLLIVQVDIIKENGSVKCKEGIATVRYEEDKYDPGHIVVNVDPPKGSSRSLDCDGKADIGLRYIGLNCLRSNLEASQHKSP